MLLDYSVKESNNNNNNNNNSYNNTAIAVDVLLSVRVT